MTDIDKRALALRVKPLEWSWPTAKNNHLWIAKSILGDFVVGFDDGWHATLDAHQGWEWEPENDPRSYDGPSPAMGACQEYLERVLLSAVEPDPALAAFLREAVDGWNFDMSAAPKTSEKDSTAKPFLALCRDEFDGCIDQRVVWWEPKLNKGRGYWYGDRDIEEHPYAWRPLPAPPAEEGK